MRWGRVLELFQAFSANGFIFSFTLLLALKLDHALHHSWWFVFTPLWWFYHAVISRGRFSLPAPSMPHDDWAPFYSVMATPLLVAFEILLFVQLEAKYAFDLKIVFLPLIALELAILVDNVRKCRPLMYGETMSDEDIWETLPHLWVSISMVLFIVATTFSLLKSRGDVAVLDWWDLFINFGIAECFGLLVCTKLSNESINPYSHIRGRNSSSTVVSYLYRNGRLVVASDEESNRTFGSVMKIPFIIIHFILFMSLEGTLASPKNIPIVVLFVPLFLLQGAVVLFATYRLVEKHVLWIFSVGGSYGRYFVTSSARKILEFFQHGARLLGRWSTNKGSQEEQARLNTGEATGYNTFSPGVVKKMPKSDLVKEVCRLQAALSEQTDISQQEKNLCIVCFEDPVNVVLLPCRHHILCSTCCKKCKKCPICRVLIKHRMPVYDV